MQDEFVHPGGERLRFLKTSLETNGELLEMEAVYNPNSEPPPSHYHPFQEEQFEVLDGSFRVRIREEKHTFQVGGNFTVQPKTPHWMHNTSAEEGRLRRQIRPAMKSRDFFATMLGLTADGKTRPNGLPNLLQLSVILRENRNEFRASKPPCIMQQLLFSLLAPIGKLSGYKARYEEYSGEAG